MNYWSPSASHSRASVKRFCWAVVSIPKPWAREPGGSLEPTLQGSPNCCAPDDRDRRRQPRQFLKGKPGNKMVLEDLALLNFGLAIPLLPAAADALDCRILAALYGLCRGQDTLHDFYFFFNSHCFLLF